MGVYDPMMDYITDKLSNGIKALRHLDKHSNYEAYAPRIAESMAQDIKSYLDYLSELYFKKRS